MSDPRNIRVTVNGKQYECAVEPRLLLCDFLRHRLHLTGTHVGCEHGVCGACTILFNSASVRSCLMLAVQADGAEISTVESLAHGQELSAMQNAFRERHALQCGFCTPGFLMVAAELVASNVKLSETEIREHLSGNLCRCTGYQGIVEAVQQTLQKLHAETGEAK